MIQPIYFPAHPQHQPLIPFSQPIIQPNPIARSFCTSPYHLPGPMGLYIPPGQTHTYRCPACGNETVLRGTSAVC